MSKSYKITVLAFFAFLVEDLILNSTRTWENAAWYLGMSTVEAFVALGLCVGIWHLISWCLEDSK